MQFEHDFFKKLNWFYLYTFQINNSLIENKTHPMVFLTGMKLYTCFYGGIKKLRSRYDWVKAKMNQIMLRQLQINEGRRG